MRTVVDDQPRMIEAADRPDAVSTARPGPALAAALLGFFVITLHAVVVNVALPTIRSDLTADMTGLQWVVDGYTLMFAALLLSAGALSDRAGARRLVALRADGTIGDTAFQRVEEIDQVELGWAQLFPTEQRADGEA